MTSAAFCYVIWIFHTLWDKCEIFMKDTFLRRSAAVSEFFDSTVTVVKPSDWERTSQAN